MQKAIGILCLVVGVVLIVWGYRTVLKKNVIKPF